MGCVQSYFKKGSYDVYEAHNAGMSPSSTHGSEKSPLGEKEIKAQEDKDEVQTAEIVRDPASVDGGEVKAAGHKEDAESSEAADSSVLGGVAAATTVAGVGAAAAIVAAKTPESVADVPATGALGTEPALTDKPQEHNGSDQSPAPQNEGDAGDVTCKTDLEKDTSVKQDEASTPVLNSRPVTAVKLSDASDSVSRENEHLLSDTEISETEGASFMQNNELNEAAILEEPVKKETDDFVVLNGQVEEGLTLSTPVSVNSGSNGPESALGHVDGGITPNREETVTSGAADEADEKSIESSIPSRPLSADTITHEVDAKATTETASEVSSTFSAVESGKEAIASRPTSVAGEEIEELGEMSTLAKPEEITREIVEEHAGYSSSVDSAEEALKSRPMSVASENVEETIKDTDITETPVPISSKIAEENVKVTSPVETVEEPVLSRPISVNIEETSKEICQPMPISSSRETDSEHYKESSSVESAEVAMPSRPASIDSDTFAGLGKEEPMSRPISVADEANEATVKNISCVEVAADVLSNRSPSAASENTEEQKGNIDPNDNVNISEKTIDSMETTRTPTEEGREISEHKTDNLHSEDEEDIDVLIGGNIEEHNEIPTSVDVAEEVLSPTHLIAAKKNFEEHIDKLQPVALLEETALSTPLNVTEVLVQDHSDDLSSIDPKENEQLCSEISEAVEKHNDQLNSPPENEVINSPSATIDETLEKHDVNELSTEEAEIELQSRPLSVASEAVEDRYENPSPAESADEKALSRPSSVVNEAVIEHVAEVSCAEPIENASLNRLSSDINDVSAVELLEEMKICSPIRSPIKIEHSEGHIENLADVAPTEDISRLASSSSSEIGVDIPSYEEALTETSTAGLLSDGSHPVEMNMENASSLSNAEAEGPSRPFSGSNEIIEVNSDVSSPTKYEEDTVIKRDLNEGNECVEEGERLLGSAESGEDDIPSRPLSVATETGGIESENSSLKLVEDTAQSRPVSVANEMFDKPIEEPVQNTTPSVTNENIELLSENVCADSEKSVSSMQLTVTKREVNETDDGNTDDIKTVSPTLSSTEDSTNAPNSDNELKESAEQEVEMLAKDVSRAEAVHENEDGEPKQTDVDEQDVTTGGPDDIGLHSEEKEENVPFISEQVDDNALEDSAAVDNDTEEIEKEDSTIASIPESIMTVPESLGDMELSSESSVGGPIERSAEETRSEDIKPDEQEDSGLVANRAEEISADIVAHNTTSENGDVNGFDSLEHKDKISRAIINGVEDESTDENMYADAFGRPVPTITLIESEELKRSDSEEESVDTISTGNEEPCQVAEEKEDKDLGTKESAQDGTSGDVGLVSSAQGEEDGEESASESVAGSDSINLCHRDDGRSDSGTSQSRGDSVFAEKGSEVDSITTVSAAPSADGARIIGEEEQDVNSREPAVQQLPSIRDGAEEVQQTVLNTAATTIQATFRGFQTRQALQKSVETTKVPAEDSKACQDGDTDVGEEKGAEAADSSSGDSADDLAHLQKPQECDELPEHRGGSSSGDAESSLSSAATKIQSCFRGYATRKRLHDAAGDSPPPSSSLANEPSIPDSQQSPGTFSTSNEDNGVRTSGSLETAVQRQQQSTLDEVEELLGSGPPLLVDAGGAQRADAPDDIGEPEDQLREAATKIQSNYRGYRARQKLTREDAVQMPTTSTSSAASVDSVQSGADVEPRASGEFHDLVVLPAGDHASHA